MIAQHRSLCPACSELIQPGERIEWSVQFGWAHALCPEATEAAFDAAALTNSRCPRCGLNHPGDC